MSSEVARLVVRRLPPSAGETESSITAYCVKSVMGDKPVWHVGIFKDGTVLGLRPWNLPIAKLPASLVLGMSAKDVSEITREQYLASRAVLYTLRHLFPDAQIVNEFS